MADILIEEEAPSVNQKPPEIKSFSQIKAQLDEQRAINPNAVLDAVAFGKMVDHTQQTQLKKARVSKPEIIVAQKQEEALERSPIQNKTPKVLETAINQKAVNALRIRDEQALQGVRGIIRSLVAKVRPPK